MSYQKTGFKYPMNLDYRIMHSATPDQLNELYKVSNPREKRFITAWRNRNKPVVETPSQFRAKNLNRALGSLSFALQGVRGLGGQLQKYAHNSKPQDVTENIAINRAGIELNAIQRRLELSIQHLAALNRNATEARKKLRKGSS